MTAAVPRHLAIVMDGNRRWAKQRHLPAIAGHRAGVETIRKTLRAARERGVEYLTLYSFSTENWTRDPDEVTGAVPKDGGDRCSGHGCGEYVAITCQR